MDVLELWLPFSPVSLPHPFPRASRGCVGSSMSAASHRLSEQLKNFVTAELESGVIQIWLSLCLFLFLPLLLLLSH